MPKQFNEDDDVYSYTLYDEQGRIVEVGEVNANDPIDINYVNDQLDQDAL